MRVAALALAAVAGTACSKGSLRSDIADIADIADAARAADGGGSIAIDATGAGDTAPGAVDAARPPPLSIDCPMSRFEGGWLPLDFLVMLDRSPSGDRAAWTTLLTALTEQIAAVARTDWGLYTFPTFGPACGVGTVPPNVDLPVVPDNQANVAAVINSMISGGAGMPTAAAIEVGAAHLRTLPAAEPKFLLLVTDRPPTCTGTGDQLSSADPALAEADAVAAIARAAAEKIGTIVLAPSTSAGETAAALDALAEAGGTPRSVGAHKFHDETTFAELFVPPYALSCVIPLRDAPPGRDVTNVTFNGLVVPRDTEHMSGWDALATPTSTNIELYGSWCDQLTASRHFEVNVFYTCML